MPVIIKHSKLPKFQETFIKTRPLSVWLSGKIELQIFPGDRLDKVARLVRIYWKLTPTESRRVVAYWFALGERVDGKEWGSWTRRSVRTNPGRKYLADRDLSSLDSA